MHAVVALAVLRLALKLELGPEYDSNANRAEVIRGAMNVDAPTGSGLIRTTARGSLAWNAGPSLLRVALGLGGKVFFNPEVFDQNVLVAQLGIDERIRLGRTVELGVIGDYFDASQLDITPSCAPMGCQRQRDFRTGTVAARLALTDRAGDLALSGGWRGFEWKPDATFDFTAGTGSAVAAAHAFAGSEGQHEFDLVASYRLERRFYNSPNDCHPDENCQMRGPDLRRDWFHESGLEFIYVGKVLVSTGYTAQLNRSSSFGQSLLRQIVTAKLAFRLPWQIYATLKAQLIHNTYLDPVLLDRIPGMVSFISIEDENRNALLVDLERPIGKSGVSVVIRYSLYTNELGDSPVAFLRQLIYVGVSYRLGKTIGKTARATP